MKDRQRDRPPTTRTVAPGVVAAALALTVATACTAARPSSGGSSTAGRPAGAPSAVAYSACMRAHGVPNFPDPASGGQLPKADAHRLGVSSAALHASQQACRSELPNGGGTITAGSIDQCMSASVCPRDLVLQVLTEEQNFARCMRAHGVPNWPDASIDAQGRPVFAISISKLGFDPYSRQVWAQGNRCSHLMPGLPGLPAAVSP